MTPRWSHDSDRGRAALVDTAVLRVLRIMHQVGPDAPVNAYLAHADWPEAVRAARGNRGRQYEMTALSTVGR